MSSLQKLFLALAQAMANATACPALSRLRLQNEAALVCKQAKLPKLPLPQATNEQPQTLLGRLALALAAVQEHAHTPVEVYNALADFSEEVMSLLHESASSEQYEAARLRWHAAVYAPEAAPSVNDLVAENARLKLLLEQAEEREQAALQTANDFEQMAAATSQYAPEIEARREHYEHLAECLHFMTTLESQHVEPLLDLTGPDEGDRDHFGNAIEAHLRVLCCRKLDWFDGRTLRKFYAEMRLWVDQLEYERAQSRQAA